MKQLSFLIIFIISTLFCRAQSDNDPLPALDKSPMDMSYFPDNYPVLKIQDKINEPVTARVIYSRPQKNGRIIFGDLVEYGKVWRMGANEATELELYKDVKIGEKKIEKGRYTLYAIPTTSNWTIILNKDVDTWGAFNYDEQKDVVRIKIPVENLSEPREALAMAFEKTDDGCNLVIAWDTVKVSLPISLK
jgi:Protein of unknown function (DUF2911)